VTRSPRTPPPSIDKIRYLAIVTSFRSTQSAPMHVFPHAGALADSPFVRHEARPGKLIPDHPG
jgi:hypothetical protein